jgi:precorrin-2 C20-methyltransferase / precorrin-3B C17-methyltransferase
VTGRVTVVGLGPGRADRCLPAVTERLLAATDLVGYGAYLDLVPVATAGRRHPSDNRVETDRARHALALAADGAEVVVVSSGDPGIFAMASAVMEALDAAPDSHPGVEVEVLPGITAAQALASRVGAPLGHDFCVISLSDVLKPWDVIEARVSAAAGADFVIALYNPVSRHRPWQLGRALEVVGRHRSAQTPVAVGRHIGRPAESVRVVGLAALDPADVDMSTVLLVGSSTTRLVPGRPPASSLYTPRRYPA